MGGEVLRCGRRTAKGVTGYDLVAGFVGTEGTFGVITELTLKLLPRPPAAATVLGVFKDVPAAGQAISTLLRGGLRPRVLELADRVSIDHVRPKSRYRFPDNAGAIVLIEVDGTADSMPAQMEAIGVACDELGAIDVLGATEAHERRAVWEARRLISSSLKEAYRIKVNEDVCVPRGKIVEMLARVDRVSQETGIRIAVFGHAGDGNLHVNLLSNEDPADPAVRAKMWAAAERVFAHTIELGGTLSGEHGIGLTKRDYVHMEQSEQLLAWQRKWKSLWDPSGLLNPGKLIPDRKAACTEEPRAPRRDVPGEEVAHEVRDRVDVRLEREVAGVEDVVLEAAQVALVGLGSSEREDRIVLAPRDQRRRLVGAKVGLPARIERRIRAVAQEQVELDLVVARAIEQVLVLGRAVGRDERGIGNAGEVLLLGRVVGQQLAKRVALVGVLRVGPVGLERSPEVVRDAFLVCVAVLYDERRDALGMCAREPEPDRCAVVLDVERVAREAELLGEPIDRRGEIVERVREQLAGGHRAVPESGIVGRDDVIAIGELGDQVAKHLRARRESVQQQDRGRVARACFAIEDVDLSDAHLLVADGTVALGIELRAPTAAGVQRDRRTRRGNQERHGACDFG
jgi:hypothetical protein